MNLKEAIYNRISRRTYLKEPIESNKINILKELIGQYNAKSDLSIEFLQDGSNAFNGLAKSYGMFKNVQSLLVMKGNKTDIHLKEKAGYYGELLILEATKLGLGTCWVGGTFDKNNKVFNLKENEEMVCVITIGNVASTTSTKENLIRSITHRKSRPLEYFYTSDTTPPQWLIEGVKAVQAAPSANNRQAYRLEYKNSDTFIKIEEKSVYDLMDLGIAKAHFELTAEGKFDLGNPAKFTKA